MIMALHLSSLVVRRVDGGNTANLYLVGKSGRLKKKLEIKRMICLILIHLAPAIVGGNHLVAQTKGRRVKHLINHSNQKRILRDMVSQTEGAGELWFNSCI